MDLNLIELPREEARSLFLEYRQSVRESYNETDAEIMRGYRALSQGSSLLSVSDAIKTGGLDEHGRPMLAIMRADVPWCRFRRQGSRVQYIDNIENGSWRGQPHHSSKVNSGKYPCYLSFDCGFGDPALEATKPYWDDPVQTFRNRAPVPVIPPRLRPAKLHTHHILWEPSWEEMPPPPDPVLLKRVSHDLYVVLATWDLTQIELQVLGRRFTE